MSKTLVALAAAAVVFTASGCCWPLHGGRHGGRGGHGGYDDRSGAERPEPPRSGRSRPAPPSWRH